VLLIQLSELVAALPTVDLPNPQPLAPPGTEGGVTAILAFAKWACLIVAVAALLVFSARLGWQMSNRGSGLESHIGGLGLILVGIVIISGSTSIVSFIYTA
jgi:hypothetical protein